VASPRGSEGCPPKLLYALIWVLNRSEGGRKQTSCLEQGTDSVCAA